MVGTDVVEETRSLVGKKTKIEETMKSGDDLEEHVDEEEVDEDE